MMNQFRWLTAGESHGKGLVTIVDGMPAGVAITEELITKDLLRRQGGYGRGKRQQIETDNAAILSGIRHGFSIGSPVAIQLENRDHDNAAWETRMATEPITEPIDRVVTLRPGHADLAGTQKYGFDDVRPVLERSSARETAARVAAGALARALLAAVGINVYSQTISIGTIQLSTELANNADWKLIEQSPVRVTDRAVEQEMIKEIDKAKADLDTLGGVFEVRAQGVPFGLGSHVQWDRKLDGRIGQAFLSINAVKAVEIGDGLANASRPGSLAQDLIQPWSQENPKLWDRASNKAGGLEAGMTNGQDIVVRGFIKPISTVPRTLPSANLDTGDSENSFYERSDVAVVPAAGIIGEAMLALVLADALLEKFGGDNLSEISSNMSAFLETVKPRAIK
ncbi:MAG TPA: chorismate synthase [Dehalococcoidia bacterium]|nr:chorismate synthase [Dehalococcoidia bacterium]